jgi:hypothetical protein
LAEEAPTADPADWLGRGWLAGEKRKADETARLAEEKLEAADAARLVEEKRKAEEAEARLAEKRRKAEEHAGLTENQDRTQGVPLRQHQQLVVGSLVAHLRRAKPRLAFASVLLILVVLASAIGLNHLTNGVNRSENQADNSPLNNNQPNELVNKEPTQPDNPGQPINKAPCFMAGYSGNWFIADRFGFRLTNYGSDTKIPASCKSIGNVATTATGGETCSINVARRGSLVIFDSNGKRIDYTYHHDSPLPAQCKSFNISQ